jgi:hypothetical protein
VCIRSSVSRVKAVLLCNNIIHNFLDFVNRNCENFICHFYSKKPQKQNDRHHFVDMLPKASTSTDKIGPFGLFLLRKSVFFLAESNASHKEYHVVGKCAHGLESLRVLLYLIGQSTVGNIPILAGRHGHTAYGKIFVENVESRCASASTGNHQ